jgi:signal transduction histidine kinase/DNA-binding response OmpR family regulator
VSPLDLRYWSLRRKLLALLLCACWAPLVATTAGTQLRARSIMEGDARKLLAATAQQIAAEVDAFNSEYVRVATRLANLPGVTRYYRRRSDDAATAAAAELDSLRQVDANIFNAHLVDRTGHVVVSTSPALVGIDLSFREHIQEALKGRSVISDVFVGLPKAGGHPLIVYDQPIVDEAKETLGVVVLTVLATGLWDVVRASNGRAGEGSYAVALDSYGIRIAHSFRQDQVFHPAGVLEPRVVDQMVRERRFGEETRALLQAALPIPAQFLRARAQSLDGLTTLESFHSPANDADNIAAATRLRTVPWTVFAVVPDYSVGMSAARLLRDSVFLSTIIFVLALGLGLLLARSVVQPIRALSRATNALAGGDFEARAPINTTDEMGGLAASFNQMATAMKAARGDLEAEVRKRTLDLQRANEELQAQKQELIAQGREMSAQQQELELKNREVERANRLKSEFLSNMSHELRTPLNAIIGFSELLEQETVNQLQPLYVTYIRDVLASGRHLLSLINDVLDLSKIEAGQMALAPEDVDPERAVAEACAIIQAPARRKRIAIHTDAQTKTNLVADSGKLRQILLNLLSNAVKFSPEGSNIEVRARESEGCIVFEVQDEGPGIDAVLMPRLFQPFVQGESPMVKKHQGTGLGLAICKRLVEQHGGTISVESTPGKGSVFRVSLPVADSQAAIALRSAPPRAPTVLVVEDDAARASVLRRELGAAGYRVEVVATGEEAVQAAERVRPAAIVVDPAAEGRDGKSVLDGLRRHKTTSEVPKVLTPTPSKESAQSSSPEPERSSTPKPPTILLVDDNESNRELARSLLERKGYRVALAPNANAALEAARRVRPALILMDLAMPGTDAFEASLAIKTSAHAAKIPIVALTALAMQGYDAKAYAAGLDGHLTEPIDPTTLEVTVTRLIGSPSPV